MNLDFQIQTVNFRQLAAVKAHKPSSANLPHQSLLESSGGLPSHLNKRNEYFRRNKKCEENKKHTKHQNDPKTLLWQRPQTFQTVGEKTPSRPAMEWMKQVLPDPVLPIRMTTFSPLVAFLKHDKDKDKKLASF